ncbi:MAG: B12-binding domain-containing radical SAM protein [Chloroflexi bacterium]|nr:B12-binding domain-containing radical SAM protein [Chloroflexota bacterium]
MKFAFVRVLGKDRYDFYTSEQVIGLGYLANAANAAGAESVIYDPYDLASVVTRDTLFQEKYAFVGFTVHFLNIEETLATAKLIKAKTPSSVVVLGGHHVSPVARDILEDHEYIDAICVGEGEDVMHQIVDIMKKGGGVDEVRKKGIFSPRKYYPLDDLPIPIRPVIESTARMSTSRGCPFSCSFCTTPAMRKLLKEPIYRDRSVDSIIEEIEWLQANGVRKIYINDDLYVLPNKRSRTRAIEIADKIIERKLDISYKAQLRVDSFSLGERQLLQHLQHSGFTSVFLGVESGSEQILEEYNKGITVDQTIATLKMYHEVGIQVNAGNMLASPNSTLNEICESIDGFRRMGLAYLFFRRATFRSHVFPGTLLEQRLIQEGRLENKPRYLQRDYAFIDPWLNKVVNRLEEDMPIFLAEIGGELFNLRNKALALYYNDIEKDNGQDLMGILDEWNELSAAFLLMLFNPSVKSLNSISFDYSFMWPIKKKLAAFVEKAANERVSNLAFESWGVAPKTVIK